VARFLLGDADHKGAAARQLFLGDLGGEIYGVAVYPEQVSGGIVEEVDYVASEAVFETAAFFQIERAY